MQQLLPKRMNNYDVVFLLNVSGTSSALPSSFPFFTVHCERGVCDCSQCKDECTGSCIRFLHGSVLQT